jgi:DNA-binding winged helix-turn-helix (wHTH) protein
LAGDGNDSGRRSRRHTSRNHQRRAEQCLLRTLVNHIDDLDELLARVRALLRRAAGRADPVLAHGRVKIDPAAHTAWLDDAPLALSAREFALLHALLERPGSVLSRAQLEERLYGWNDAVGSNAVEVHIHHLRRKLGDGVVRNVRGVGYTLAAAACSAAGSTAGSAADSAAASAADGSADSTADSAEQR